MNAEIFRRVAWKEYRTLRGLWILLAVLTVCIQLLMYFGVAMNSPGPKGVPPDVLYAIALVFMALFALGASVMLFAVEREEGTSEYLRHLPTDARSLFIPKSIAALVGLLLLGVTLALSTTALVAVLDRIQPFERDRLASVISQLGLIPLEMLAWGILFSMITRRAVVSACLCAAAASTTIHLSAKLVAPNAWLRDLEPYAAAVFPYRLLFLVVAIGIDVWLGRRWLRIMPLEDWLGAWRSRREATVVVDEATELREAQPRPSRAMTLQRLTWQAFRLGRVPMLALIGVSALLIVILSSLNDAYDSPSDRTSWAGLVATVIVALAGSCVFLADHQGSRFRFFSERPANATALWLSRQLCWLTVVAVSILLGMAWWVFAIVSSREALIRPIESNPWGYPTVAIYTGTLGQMPVCLAFGLGTLLAFSAGQLCSMFFRSGILAAVFSVLLCGLFYGWVVLQESFGVSWLLSVAPLTLIAFFVSWLHTRDWLDERTGPRMWTRAGLSVVLPLVAMIAVLAYCRVGLVPDVEPGFSLADYAALATPEARETEELYKRAGELLQRPNWNSLYEIQEQKNKLINQQRASGVSAAVELAAVRQQEAKLWDDTLAQNQPALELFLQASERSHSAPRVSDPLYLERRGNAQEGERLLLKDAARLTRAGDLEKTLSRTISSLRAHVHLNEHRTFNDGSISDQHIMTQLIEWSTVPGQTPERIRRAIVALSTWEASVPSPDDRLMALYEWASAILSDDSETEAQRIWEDRYGYAHRWEVVALRYVPWERARARRVLNLLTAEDLHRSRKFFNATGATMTLERARLVLESYDGIQPWMRSTKLLRALSMDMTVSNRGWNTRIDTQMLVGSTQIRLALVAWQIERADLPASLNDLVGPYFEQLPLDPNTRGEYRYFPNGVQTELEWRYDGDPEVLPVGTPLLWSPGSRLMPDLNPANAPLRLYLPIDANRYHVELGGALNETQSLQRGVIMPIPRPPTPTGAAKAE